MIALGGGSPAELVDEIKVLTFKAMDLLAEERKVCSEIKAAGFFDSKYAYPQIEVSQDRPFRDYLAAWRSGLETRKPALGFHPGVYRDHHPELTIDPTIDFIRQGKPKGPWLTEVLRGEELKVESGKVGKKNSGIRAALHLHLHYTEGVEGIFQKINASASRPDLFISSGSVSNSVAAARTALDSPVVLPTNQVVTFAVTVTMSNPATGPSGTSIRYTTNNTQPSLANGFTYSSPFSLSSFAVNENKTLRATRTVSGSLTNWFDQSPDVVRVYTGPAFAGSGIPSGALVGSATLNSTFNGSVTIAYPTNGVVPSITYNANAVINGSLYVPGTPRVAQNSPFIPQWTPTNDLQFSNRI
jgi:hypothetical protein